MKEKQKKEGVSHRELFLILIISLAPVIIVPLIMFWDMILEGREEAYYIVGFDILIFGGLILLAYFLYKYRFLKKKK